MDPVTAAALAGAATSMMNNQAASGQSTKERAFNKVEAQKTRDWQEFMSSTAHQREVKDLKKAGLNPLLGISQSGAATGGGATASTTATPMENIGARAISSAMEAKQMMMAQEKQKSEIGLLQAQSNKSMAETASLKADMPKKTIQSNFWKSLDEASQTGAKILKQTMHDAQKAFLPQQPVRVNHTGAKQ